MYRTNRINSKIEYGNDEYYKRLYGKDAVITRLGRITIVHLGHPGKKKIRKRKEEIIREELNGEPFFDNCPLCREFNNQPYDIVYYM